jgi:hypothetical protein
MNYTLPSSTDKDNSAAAVPPPLPKETLAPIPAKDLTKAEIKERSRKIKAAAAAEKQAKKDAKLAPKREREERKARAKAFDERAKKKKELETLAPGESVIKGFCPDCGDVAVKHRKGGYSPSILSWIVHIGLCIFTAGGWFIVWGMIMLAATIFKWGETKTCMKCGKSLQQS